MAVVSWMHGGGASGRRVKMTRRAAGILTRRAAGILTRRAAGILTRRADGI